MNLTLQTAADVLKAKGYDFTLVKQYPRELIAIEVNNLGVDIRGEEDFIGDMFPTLSVNRIQETIYITNKRA